MVQIILPPLPEQETAPEKRPMMVNDTDQDLPPLNKRHKSSSLQTTHEWSCVTEPPVPHCQYDPLNEPNLLGLKLKKTPSALELYEAQLNEARIAKSKKDAEARPAVSGPVDNLKASNFPAVLLRIGKWEYVSKYEGDLVAKCYFAKHKIVWEVLDGGLKNKIEFEWEAIVGLKAHCPDNGPNTLNIVLNKQPLFFRETNPQPRKHTVWQATTDFTDGEASRYRQHYLQCAPGVLNKHYEKLMNCDTRLNFLSQQALKDSVIDPNVLNNDGSSLVHGDIIKQHGLVEGWRIVRSKAIALVNAAMSAHNIVPSAEIPAWVNEVNQSQFIENISRVVLTDTRLTTPSDERSPMLGVNYGNESNGYSDTDVGNFHGNDRFTPIANSTPENENNGISRVDSLTDLLHQLPQIESLPRIFYDTSQGDDIMGF